MLCWIIGQFDWSRSVVWTWLGIDHARCPVLEDLPKKTICWFASHRAIVPKSWPRRWPWARHQWEKRISIDNTGSSDSASPPTANRAKGQRIPQVLDDGLALRRTWPCRASHSHRRGRRADLSSLFRHRLLSPSEPNQGAMGSPVVRHALLLSLLCAGALGFLLCCHGAAVAPAYVTVSAASFAPSSTCSASGPGIASQPDQLL